MLKKIDLYIIKSFIVPFLITFVISEIVLVMQFLFVYIDDFVGKGLGFMIFAELIYYALMEVVPMALPLAILLASIMTIGNLGEHSELVALKSSGFSFIRIMRPMLYFMFIIAMISFYFSNYVWGNSYLQKRILISDMTNKKLSLILKEGIFFNEIENTSIRPKKIDKEKDLIYNILIMNYDNEFNFRKLIIADTAKIKKSNDGNYLILELHSGQINEFINPNKNNFEEKSYYPHQKILFDQTTQKINISSLKFDRSTSGDFADQPRLSPIFALTNIIDSLNKRDIDDKAKFLIYFENSMSLNNLAKEKNIKNNKINNPKYLSKIYNTFSLDSLDTITRINIIDQTKIKVQSMQSYYSNYYDNYNNKNQYLIRVKIEWHRKFTLAIACIVLFFIGAPLGSIVNKGGLGIPMALAIFIFILYYFLSTIGENLAKSFTLLPYEGMWLSTLILVPIGLILSLHAVSDNNLLTFSKIKNIFKSKK